MTNSRSMMGGAEEGKKWIGKDTELKVNPTEEAGGWLFGTITKFDPDQPMLDQTWTVKWDGNDKTIEYDYRGIKEIVREQNWVPQTRLSNANPGHSIVDGREQLEIQSLTKGGLNSLWKGMFPNAWMKVLCTGGVDARTAKSQTRKLRDTLLEGQHDIWKARNDRKHNKIITPGSMEDKEIDQIFRVIRKLRLDLHGCTPEEIKKRTTKARDIWKTRQWKRAKAAHAQMETDTKKEKNRIAHLSQRKQNNEHITQITQRKTKQGTIAVLRGTKHTSTNKPPITHETKEDKEDKEEVLKELRYALIGLNQIKKIPEIGSAITKMQNTAEGTWWRDPNAGLLDKVAVDVFKSLSDEDYAKALIAATEIAVGFNSEIFIGGDPTEEIGGLAGIATGNWDEEAMDEALGISKSYRPSK